ncbi:uncharacterized protein A4U43_C04F16000 [Asparagus officinalis]|uniref:Uncharacterized protein n=1 Tax=Asparagus officinalis TaxID=4686 RepID=A0A5P1F1T8_ASPOF|nr:uncharacterized protein A4U43_C04F16000 [Asparagus officinalis]
MPPAGLEHLFPHCVADIGEEEWERMRKYLIRTSGVGSRYGQEPAWSTASSLITILTSWRLSWALTRFSQRWSSSSSFLKMRSFYKGFLMSVWTVYLKLLGEVTSLRADRGVNMKRAAETPVLSVSEVDGLSH